MPLPMALRIALYLLVADGIFALYLAEFIGHRAIVVVSTLLVATWLVQRSGRDDLDFLLAGESGGA